VGWAADQSRESRPWGRGQASSGRLIGARSMTNSEEDIGSATCCGGLTIVLVNNLDIDEVELPNGRGVVYDWQRYRRRS
jgi:hypothetical protein